jgi:hypothetical protein
MSISTLHEIEKTWKQEIHKGNLFYNTSSFIRATDHYMSTMIASQLLLENTATVTG